MAVGKLTVSKALKDLCDAEDYPIKIFHNHHTVDLITEFIPSFTPLWFKLNGSFRMQMYAACAEIGQNLITTLVFAKNSDEEFIDEIKQSVKPHRGEVLFVQLTADLDTLLSRVNNEDRHQYRKLTSIEGYHNTLSKYDILSAIPGEDCLVVNTDTNKPEDAARIIFEHYLR
jgi:hypothetical protein